MAQNIIVEDNAKIKSLELWFTCFEDKPESPIHIQIEVVR